MFSNDFFTHFSWSGGSRSGARKAMFRKYQFFQEFFNKLVRQSHPNFTEALYEEFFKNRIIKNSGSRAKCRGMRNPAVKYRKAPLKFDEIIQEMALEELEGPNENAGDSYGDDNENVDCSKTMTQNVYEATSSKILAIPVKVSPSRTPDGDGSIATESINEVPIDQINVSSSGANNGSKLTAMATNSRDSIISKRKKHQTNSVKRKRTRRVDQFNLKSEFLIDESSNDSDICESDGVSFPYSKLVLLLSPS